MGPGSKSDDGSQAPEEDERSRRQIGDAEVTFGLSSREDPLDQLENFVAEALPGAVQASLGVSPLDQVEDVRLLVEEFERCRGDGPQLCFGMGRFRHLLVDPLGKLHTGAFEQGQIKFIFVPEVSVERPFTEPGLRGDVFHADFVEPLRAEQSRRDFQDALRRGMRLRGHVRSPRRDEGLRRS